MWERNKLKIDNPLDANGTPTGGSVTGTGLRIEWQNGPLGRVPVTPNGAFVDDVIEAARQRLEFYQKTCEGKFASHEIAIAITKLDEALHWLFARRLDRENRKAQGTCNP